MTGVSLASARGRGLWTLLLVPPAAAGLWLLTQGAVAGFDVRPAADDWCAVGWIEKYGAAGMIWHYYADVNGRLANAAAQVLVYADGLRGARALPALLVLSLTTGIFALLLLVLRHLRWPSPAASSGLLAIVVSALTFFAGNRVYQVFHWPAGTVSHTLPAILGLWTLVLALAAARGRSWARTIAVAAAFLVGSTIGTLSESFFLVSGVYAGTALVVAAASWRDRRARFPLAWLSAWIGGLLTGFALLYTSPGMAVRTSRSRPQPSLLSADGFGEALQGWQSTWTAIASQPAYYAAVAAGILVGLLAGKASLRATPLPFSGGSWTPARKALVLLVPAVLVVVASFGVLAGLWLGYGRSGWRYERVWTNFLAAALLTAALYGVVGGWWLGRRLSHLPRSAGRAVSAAALIITSVLSTAGLLSLVPANAELNREMAVRAKAWDANDAAVKRQVAAGKRVVRFTPTPVAGSTEPFRLTAPGTDWVSGCVASYYGADGLKPSKAWLSSPASARYRSETGRR